MDVNIIAYVLGNDRLHILTSHGKYQLLITMEDFAENNRYALYDTFKVGDEKSKYVLTINSYMGSAGRLYLLKEIIFFFKSYLHCKEKGFLFINLYIYTYVSI